MEDKAVSSAILRFSARFLNELDKTKSVVSSPLSAETLLALLVFGSSGSVRSELLTELGFSDEAAVRSSFESLLFKLKSIAGVTLNMANKLYLMEGLELQPEMQKNAELLDSSIEQVDFCDTTTAQRINQWVENRTNNKIKNVFSPSDANADTQLVLINAIYFKGDWKTPFDPNSTEDRPFRVDANKTVLVPTMIYRKHQEFKLGNSTGLNAQILELPYKDDEAKMLIVLPGSVDGLDEMLQALANGYDLMSDIAALRFRKVNFRIPKFKIETEMNLKVLLKKLGIKQLFDEGLENIVKDGKPKLSEAVQKAFIEVNEIGTEAAAVTKMKLIKKSGPRLFVANRPFLYVLMGPADVVLFVGTYRGDLNAPPCDFDFEAYDPYIDGL